MHDPNADHRRASSAVAELQQILLTSDNLDEFLQQLTTLTVAAISSDLSCGITMRRDHRPITVASSDARADQVDEIQYGQGTGPCLNSLDTGRPVLVEDLAAERRWGPYPISAVGHGVRSSLSLPLRTNGTVIGVLNLYSPIPHAFGEREQAAAKRFADEASRALGLALRLAAQTEMSQDLLDALSSRAVIDQALGIIMGQKRCTADEAFDTLRTISQNRNIKLRDIAEEIITAVSGQPPSANPRFS
jgi:GAF domain-containing protein